MFTQIISQSRSTTLNSKPYVALEKHILYSQRKDDDNHNCSAELWTIILAGVNEVGRYF